VATEETLRDYLKWATTNLHDAQRRLREMEEQSREPVAIVGIGCRFPGGARDPESLWELLAAGGDAIAGLPTDRGWDPAALRDLESEVDGGASELNAAGFIYELGEFDAGFFGISPREAVAMDPQQRLLLEVSWEALERAGIDPRSLRGSRTGVFTGAAVSGYGFGPGLERQLDGHLLTGTASSVVSGRVSYTLGLEGPAVTVDTACSSSLVALHLACQALRSGECTLALAGGVTVLATPTIFTQFSTQLGLAPDGRCKAFSASADGMGVAEGVGMLLVERLSDARRHGHPVLAVIRGSAINQDGASNGLTAPNGPSQQRVIRAALANARLSSADVDVVEAHGTGTELGDPIEAQALLATYGQDRPQDRPLWLGSIKSNIGHAQAAAGVAGVIKMVLALQNGRLPRTLHAEEPSPHIDWTAGAVRLLNEAVAWPANDRPRRAGVSGFGMSGTNVHMILEETPGPEEEAEDQDGAPADADADADVPAQAARPVVPVLSGSDVSAWLVSGRSADGLAAQAGRLREFVVARPALDAGDVAWSLVTTRSVFEHRAVVTGSGREELAAGLAAVATGQPSAGVVTGTAGSTGVGRIVFVFPGQGSQWAGMGRELLVSSPVFAARFGQCGEALAPFVDWSLADVLAGVKGAPSLESADVVQPVLWAVMVSLAAVWQAAGVNPDAVVGHSQGEIAAACVAGILSLEDGARVVALRSRALSVLAGKGGMLSVAEPADRVRERLGAWGERLSVAAVNGPAATVVSGEPQALAELAELCGGEGVRTRMVPVDYASHSAQVEALEPEILKVLRGITPGTALIPMISAMSGEMLAGPEMDPAYWYASLRSPVEFDRAIRTLAGRGHRTFIEASPHPGLTTAIIDTLEDAGTASPVVVGTLRRDEGGAARLLASLAEAHVHGVRVDWTAVLGAGGQVELPTYAFQRQHYWTQAAPSAAKNGAAVQSGSGSEAEARFWAAIEEGNLQELTDTLAVDGQRPLSEVLPALASWRQRERNDSAVAGWRYRVSWVPMTGAGSAVLAGTWLVVVPAGQADGASALGCIRALTDRGAETVVVEVGAGDLDRPALAERIRQAVSGPEGAPRLSGVLSLWALDETPVAGSPVVTGGVAGTLLLTQALGDAGVAAPLWAVTRGGVGAAPGEVPSSPVQAQVWGLGRVVGLEHPDRWGGLIDLPPSWDERAAARLCAVLADGTEDQVALRASGTLARRLVRAEPRRGNGGAWAPRGTVLVTGATGAIGPRLLDWLVRCAAPYVVLPTRSGPSAPGTAALAAKLAGAGTGVSVVACDIAQRPQVAGALAWITANLPPLTAVVHAANLVHLTSLESTDLAEMHVALGAKAAGAVWLDQLTEELGIELDAFVLFSSIAATWGGKEHGAYAAANAFLDALAMDRRTRGLTATAVAWGVWDTRKDDEMDMELPAVVRWLQKQGMGFLNPGRALAALDQVLADDETFIAVADVDWSLFAPVFTSARSWPLLDELAEVRQSAAAAADPAASGAAGELAQSLAAAPPAQRTRIVLDLIQAHAAAVLGYASPHEVDPERAFRDMGFDSLTAIELRNRLNAACGLQLSSTVVFDYPSATVLSREMVGQLLGATQAAAEPVAATAGAPGEPIAIVGMGCRYPGGVRDPEQLWELLAAGGDAVSGFPTNRGWDLSTLFDTDPDNPRTSYVSQGGFLHAAPEFDPAFFGISPREAMAMDPQQRLLLEVSWEALERAGIDPVTLRGSQTGVFAGGAPSGYIGQALTVEGAEGHLITGNAISVLSGRVSYTFGLEGPAVTIDTACSSSLVALHLAAQALRSGECSLALAGGVQVMADPAGFVGFSRQRALASDGRCKAFSAEADGMGMGEGAGMLLLERLSDAQRNGHRVLAVVTGSALNQDGASNGLTAPNGPSQQRVIRAALANARLSSADIDVVEAHGTGTTLGDPIEAQALLATYGRERPADRPLWLGSVKSNIGHAQAASGVAGLIKMTMALQHGVLPATLYAHEPSPHVDWSAGAVRLLNEPVPWPVNGRPRRAGVSSFGMSGTNAHVIIEEAPAVEDGAADEDGGSATPAAVPAAAVLSGSGVSAWPVSGRSAESLAAQAGRLREYVVGHPDLDPADIGWSLATTRSTFEHRAVVTGSGREALAAGLAAVATRQPAAGVVTGSPAPEGTGRVVFVFPGQGSQWVGMGRELLVSSPVFAARFAQCAEALAPFVDWSLDDVLAGAEGAPGFQAADVVQPVLWAVMVSLAAVWQAAGVVPDAVVGHSQGEIAAACVAGILSLRDGARVVALRSKALTALAGKGGMLSVAESADRVRERLGAWGERLSVAAVNGPAATVVSGEPQALEDLAELCGAEGIRTRMVPVDYASHSAQVEALEREIEDVLDGIFPDGAAVPMISAMSGEMLAGPEMDPAYWYASLRSPVEFDRAIRTLASQGHRTFIEVSPHPGLTGAITDTLEDAAQEGCAALASAVIGTLRRDEGGPARLLASFAEAHVHGVRVDWPAVLGGGRRIALPTYAFQHQSFWPQVVPRTLAPLAGEAVVSPAEARFWAAVEDGDLSDLTDTLAIDGERPLNEALPALASWRRRERTDSTVSDWRYRATWAPVTDPGAAVLSGTWLVVVPAGQAHAQSARDCIRALSERGAAVVTVETGPEGLDRVALARVLTEALAGFEDAGAAGVLSLLSLDEEPVADFPAVSGGVAGTLVLVQALGDAGIGAPLWALTRGAVATGPGEALTSPVQAQVWGLGRVAGLEHPERWGGLIDLPPSWDDRAAARLCAVLAGCGEDQVALRPGGIMARRLVRAPQPRESAPWTPRGTVLITGGTGGIGGYVGHWLATRGAPRLVLSSRSGPAAPEVAALAARLAGAGAQVEVVACDTARRADVEGLLGRIAARGPALSSVIHSAGVGQGTAVAETTVAEQAMVSAVKTAGAVWLDELTADLDLDAFVLFSSGAATWGSGLQPGYAAANAFLDALAENRRSRGLAATSVAWGLWGGVGMGAGDVGEQLQRYGLRVMDPDLATRALAQAIDGGDGVITIADVDWTRFAPTFTLHRPSPLLESLPEVRRALAAAEDGPAAAPSHTELEQRLSGRPRPEQDRLLTELVRGEAAAVLGHSSSAAVEPGRAFKDLGFDSVTAVELRNRLNAATGLRLSSTLVFDYPTSAVLADHLRAQICGDGDGAGEPVFAELDQLESVLSAIPADSDIRTNVTVRLQTVLSKWMSAQDAPKRDAVAGRLDAASADEVLDFINQQFGMS
jgi:acyl transferase domain-containing protein/acyl carrier protein